MYTTTQEERFEWVMKLAQNADLFSEYLPGAQLLEGDGWNAGVSGTPFEIFNSGIIYKNRNEAADEIIAKFEEAQCAGTIKLFGAGQAVAGHLVERG